MIVLLVIVIDDEYWKFLFFYEGVVNFVFFGLFFDFFYLIFVIMVIFVIFWKWIGK